MENRKLLLDINEYSLKEKIKEFEAIVRPMDDLIRMNFTENDRLTELREKLLLNFFNGK